VSNSQAKRPVGVFGRMREFLSLMKDYHKTFVGSKSVPLTAILTRYTKLTERMLI